MGHWLIHRLSSGATPLLSHIFPLMRMYSFAGDNALDIVVIGIPAFISGILLQPFVSMKVVWVTSQASLAEGFFHQLGYSLYLPDDPGLVVSCGRHI